jgi:hypothetical protein
MREGKQDLIGRCSWNKWQRIVAVAGGSAQIQMRVATGQADIVNNLPIIAELDYDFKVLVSFSALR